MKRAGIEFTTSKSIHFPVIRMVRIDKHLQQFLITGNAAAILRRACAGTAQTNGAASRIFLAAESFQA